MPTSSRWGWFACDTCAQLPVNALRRELRGEPYAGKPHVRFGEGGVSQLAHPYLYGTEWSMAERSSRNTRTSPPRVDHWCSSARFTRAEYPIDYSALAAFW